jgi:hypothetical protein
MLFLEDNISKENCRAWGDENTHKRHAKIKRIAERERERTIQPGTPCNAGVGFIV